MITEQQSSMFKQNLVRRYGPKRTALDAFTQARSSEAQEFLALRRYRAVTRPMILQPRWWGEGVGAGA